MCVLHEAFWKLNQKRCEERENKAKKTHIHNTRIHSVYPRETYQKSVDCGECEPQYELCVRLLLYTYNKKERKIDDFLPSRYLSGTNFSQHTSIRKLYLLVAAYSTRRV